MTTGIPPWLVGAGGTAVTFLLTLLSGKIVVPTFAYQRERDRADKLEAENAALHAANVSVVVPALVTSSEAVRESNEVVKTALAVISRRRT